MNRKIILLIIIQTFSLFSTHMASFSLNLFLYEETKSLIVYSYFFLFIFLPELLFTPIIGYYLDKIKTKQLIMIGHIGGLFSSALILLLIFNENYNLYFIFILIAISSIFNAFTFSSLDVVISLEVVDSEMNTISSILQFAFALVLILSPIVSTFLLEHKGILIIFYWDIITFIIVITIILMMPFSSNILENKIKKNILFEFKESLHYLKKDELLFFNLLLFGFINFILAQVTILITPIILSISSVEMLGKIISIGGIGMLIGSVIPIFFQLERYRYWTNVFIILQFFVLLAAIYEVNILGISIGTLIFMLLSSIINVLNYSFWQNRVDSSVSGRLFSLRKVVILCSFVLGYLLSVPLSNFAQLILTKINTIHAFIGYNLHPEIRLLFIIDGLAMLFLIAIIEGRRVYIHGRN